MEQQGGKTIYGKAIGHDELYLGLPSPGRKIDRKLLHDVIKDRGYMEIDLSPMLSASSIDDIKNKALYSRGYREKIEGELGEGEFRIEGNLLKVRLIRSKYPHNLVGITRSGKIVAINLNGDKFKGIGYRIEELGGLIIKETSRLGDPIREVFLLSNSRDVNKYVNGALVESESSANPYPGSSALLVFSKSAVRKGIHFSTGLPKKLMEDLENLKKELEKTKQGRSSGSGRESQAGNSSASLPNNSEALIKELADKKEVIVVSEDGAKFTFKLRMGPDEIFGGKQLPLGVDPRIDERAFQIAVYENTAHGDNFAGKIDVTEGNKIYLNFTTFPSQYRGAWLVEVTWRGRNIGRALMAFAMGIAKANGHKEFLVDQPFIGYDPERGTGEHPLMKTKGAYVKLGFEEIGKLNNVGVKMMRYDFESQPIPEIAIKAEPRSGRSSSAGASEPFMPLNPALALPATTDLDSIPPGEKMELPTLYSWLTQWKEINKVDEDIPMPFVMREKGEGDNRDYIFVVGDSSKVTGENIHEESLAFFNFKYPSYYYGAGRPYFVGISPMHTNKIARKRLMAICQLFFMYKFGIKGIFYSIASDQGIGFIDFMRQQGILKPLDDLYYTATDGTVHPSYGEDIKAEVNQDKVKEIVENPEKLRQFMTASDKGEAGNPRAGAAILELTAAILVAGLVAVIALSVAAGITLIGPSEFLHSYLYYASGALPGIVKAMSLAGFSAFAMARVDHRKTNQPVSQPAKKQPAKKNLRLIGDFGRKRTRIMQAAAKLPQEAFRVMADEGMDPQARVQLEGYVRSQKARLQEIARIGYSQGTETAGQDLLRVVYIETGKRPEIELTRDRSLLVLHLPIESLDAVPAQMDALIVKMEKYLQGPNAGITTLIPIIHRDEKDFKKIEAHLSRLVREARREGKTIEIIREAGSFENYNGYSTLFEEYKRTPGFKALKVKVNKFADILLNDSLRNVWMAFFSWVRNLSITTTENVNEDIIAGRFEKVGKSTPPGTYDQAIKVWAAKVQIVPVLEEICIDAEADGLTFELLHFNNIVKRLFEKPVNSDTLAKFEQDNLRSIYMAARNIFMRDNRLDKQLAEMPLNPDIKERIVVIGRLHARGTGFLSPIAVAYRIQTSDGSWKNLRDLYNIEIGKTDADMEGAAYAWYKERFPEGLKDPTPGSPEVKKLYDLEPPDLAMFRKLIDISLFEYLLVRNMEISTNNKLSTEEYNRASRLADDIAEGMDEQTLRDQLIGLCNSVNTGSFPLIMQLIDTRISSPDDIAFLRARIPAVTSASLSSEEKTPPSSIVRSSGAGWEDGIIWNKLAILDLITDPAKVVNEIDAFIRIIPKLFADLGSNDEEVCHDAQVALSGIARVGEYKLTQVIAAEVQDGTLEGYLADTDKVSTCLSAHELLIDIINTYNPDLLAVIWSRRAEFFRILHVNAGLKDKPFAKRAGFALHLFGRLAASEDEIRRLTEPNGPEPTTRSSSSGREFKFNKGWFVNEIEPVQNAGQLAQGDKVFVEVGGLKYKEIFEVMSIEPNTGKIMLHSFEGLGRDVNCYLSTNTGPQYLLYKVIDLYSEAEQDIKDGKYKKAIDLAGGMSKLNSIGARLIMKEAYELAEKSERVAISIRSLVHGPLAIYDELSGLTMSIEAYFSKKENAGKEHPDFSRLAHAFVNLWKIVRKNTKDRLPTPSETRRWQRRLEHAFKDFADASVYVPAEYRSKYDEVLGYLSNRVRFAKNEMVSERVDMAGLLNEALDLIRKNDGVDRAEQLDLQGTPPVIVGDRVSLLISFSDVIHNAVQAVDSKVNDTKSELHAAAAELETATADAKMIDQTRVRSIQSRIHQLLKRLKPAPVKVTLKESGGAAVVSINDKGTGMEKAYTEPGSSGRPPVCELNATKHKKGIGEDSGTGLGMAGAWVTIADHKGAMLIESAIGKGTKTTVSLPTTRGSSSGISKMEDRNVVIGVRAERKTEVERALADLGTKFTIEEVSSAEALAAKYAREETSPALMFIDNNIPINSVREAALVARLASYRGVFTSPKVDSKTARDIIALIKEILENDIQNMHTAEVFAAVLDAINKGTLSGKRDKLADLQKLLNIQVANLSNENQQYNDMTMYELGLPAAELANAENKDIAVATTELVAMQDPTFARDVNTMADKHTKAVMVYGKYFKTEADAMKFAEKCGIDLNKIVFVEGRYDREGKIADMDEVMISVQTKLGTINANNIGIRAAKGEVSSMPAKGKFLAVQSVKINGKEVLLTMNTDKVLYRILKLASDDGKVALDRINILGLSKDDKGVFIYLPPTLPINYGEEVEAYRNAVILLSSAA